MPQETHELMFQLLKLKASPVTFVTCRQVGTIREVTAFINGWKPMPESVKAFCRDWITQGRPDYQTYLTAPDKSAVE